MDLLCQLRYGMSTKPTLPQHNKNSKISQPNNKVRSARDETDILFQLRYSLSTNPTNTMSNKPNKSSKEAKK